MQSTELIRERTIWTFKLTTIVCIQHVLVNDGLSYSSMRPDVPCITERNRMTDGETELDGSSLALGAHHNILEGVLLSLIPGQGIISLRQVQGSPG